jgi:hypothetical protein
VTIRILSDSFDVEYPYDLVIVALGYETRSSHLLRLGLSAARILALPFTDNQVAAFSDNYNLATSLNCVIAPTTEDSLGPTLAEMLAEILPPNPHAETTIAIDISSFTRSYLASILATVSRMARQFQGRLIVHFVYSPARYTAALQESPPRLAMAPIGAGFGGTLRRSDLPLGVVFGLGYEPQQAVGAYEILEPSSCWAFFPRGSDRRFMSDVERANSHLLSILPPEAVLPYDLSEPATLISSLESLSFSLAVDTRVLLVPMGPKIFTLAALLVALSDQPARPAVWRVGQVKYTAVQDIEESGELVSVSIGMGLGWPY